MTSRLIIYDTSNFSTFPIGGQLTSITNFLRFLSQSHPTECKRVLLIGVTTEEQELGHLHSVKINQMVFDMLPVALADTNLSNTAKSLRLKYAKGLLKFGRKIHISSHDCNYIHTPEAYGIVKLLNPFSSCIIFSHGSYFNMERGFRFFQKNVLIKKSFMLYIKRILRNAKLIFVLDNDSYNAYLKYNKRLKKVYNSIICPSHKEKQTISNRLIFVGRLSKDKNIVPIINAVNQLQTKELFIVGDGEEYDTLSPYASNIIHFTGAVSPADVKSYMLQADILIMNSNFEGIPMTILEALSLGLPVISTPVGGIPSILSFGEDSESTDGTTLNIIEKISKIYASYDRYSNHAFQHAQKFDYLSVNQEIYNNLKKFWHP